jgi:hypothetical protein
VAVTTHPGAAPDTETIRQTVCAAGEQVAELIPVVTDEGEAPVDPEEVGEVVADKGYHSNHLRNGVPCPNEHAECHSRLHFRDASCHDGRLQKPRALWSFDRGRTPAGFH